MLWLVIVGCEVGFWVLLVAGVSVRYLLRWRAASTVLLWCVPLLDVVLLIATIAELRAGATGEFQHGLAAAYIGFSVMFGHSTVAWLDRWAAHRLDGAPRPAKSPKYGPARVRLELIFMVKLVAAYAITWGITGLTVLAVDDSVRTAPLVEFTSGLTKIVVICAIISGIVIADAWRKPTGRAASPTPAPGPDSPSTRA